ncbi:hypothetical protein M408DRAFT_308049 [Serendipita vermifera MAFF 305830]|uniref:Uncharacterized protein n=1 Tax=Serendipita vermifera MAFF 305830 TaxID=933852 RepID=A0A0C3B983_SERVB|nr:hypothetical protein M408DRAFT_308049 [Serendipita vermifera MAFF 305830]
MRYMREEDEARRQEHRKSGTSSINRRSRDPSGKPVQPTGILKKTGTSATFTDRMPSVSPPSPDLVDLIQGPWSESEDDRSDDDELRSNTIYNATKPKYHPDRDGYATPWDRRLWIEGHRPLGRYKKSDSIRGGDGAGRGGGTGGGVIAYVPVLFTILPVNQTTRAILQLFRLFGECQVLISFRRHTEQTLKKLRDVLNRMRMAPLQKPLDLRLNTVKMHVLHTHLVDSIKAKGPAQNTSTSFGEACHPQSKKDCRLTNQQENEFEVTIKIALRRQTIQKIRDRVDGEAETDQVARSTQRIESSIHVVFGSPDPRTTVGQLLQNLQIPEHLPPLDHGRLLTSLKTCLYHNSDVFKTGSMTFNSHTPIIPQKYARIRYVSKHNNELLEDKIRVNRQWYGKGPRYDYILVNLDGESVSCAQLHSMFTLKVNKEDTLQIALIRILKNLSRNATTGFIHASESTEYRFVSTKCFVRSAYVHPPTRDHPRYIVNDFIDPDIQCVHVLTGHTSLVGLLGLSYSYLVSAATDSTIRVWDPPSGELLHTLAAHTGPITCLQHDEFKILSGSSGTLKMWDIRDGTNVRTFLAGTNGIRQVAFDGRWCVAAPNRHEGTFIDVWDFGNGIIGDGEQEWVGKIALMAKTGTVNPRTLR